MEVFVKNIEIINEGKTFNGSVLIKDDRISRVITSDSQDYYSVIKEIAQDSEFVIDGQGLYLIPGVIDDQVHFREPGATNKADIKTESAAAVLGGVTSFMDMPNNNPPITSIDALESKFELASKKSYANYSFYLGATNENLSEIMKLDSTKVCGLKVFMGSSTGNMLVNDDSILDEIFKSSPTLIATHCEDEDIIRINTEKAIKEYGEDIPFSEHPVIRSREGCIKSTLKAIGLASKHNSRLHILHMSTSEEVDILEEIRDTNQNISGEICVHYLNFNSEDYEEFGPRIKCNPAIKSRKDMLALRNALNKNIVSVVATDHAPHLITEKEKNYLSSPSGLPLVQHSLGLMLKLSNEGVFTKEKVIEMMCHSPADCFGIVDRGYIREGYYADIVILDIRSENIYEISKENIGYKCGWSPLEGVSFNSKILYTFVNGKPVVKDGKLQDGIYSKRLEFKKCNE